MKLQQLILPLLLGAVLAACSPRVDDVFDNTSIERLEARRTELKNRLIQSQNGWVMQYFAQTDPTTSDTLRHRGYTFLMQFREDGTVTVGAPVDGVFNTETSMWDIINDNSSVLTFNTFNRIFHYYSNPDPDLGLWGADGTGVGGDYEFMVLEYNTTEGYQLLKGKKNSCYVRLYPLAEGQDWEDYFAQIDAMNTFLFEENTPFDLYDGNKHITLYNGRTHEFRAFTFGADTLGGGAYYGLLVTDKGIRLHDDSVLTAMVHRADFRLNDSRTRLVSVLDPNVYLTVDGSTAFVSDANSGKPWNMDMNTLPASVTSAISTLNAAIAAVVPNSYVSRLRWDGAGTKTMNLRIYYTISGVPDTSFDVFYFDLTSNDGSVTLAANGGHAASNIDESFGALNVAKAFDGTYSIDLQHGFHPSQGVTATRTDDAAFVLKMKH